MKREISAGIIICRKTEEGPKFLLLYHGRNYWNFPKGHVESEEKSREAAVRETKEETGIGRRDLEFKEGFKAYDKYFFRRGKEKIFKIVIFYLAETGRKEVKISWEHEGYGWFTCRKALEMTAKYKDTQKILKQACEFLNIKK